MATTPFEDGLADAQTAITGYIGDAMPVVAAVAVAFIGLKYLRRILGKL